MGIRPTGPLEFPYDDLVTFSEDILKIEINGPEQPALTVIDVPGIFRTATEGQFPTRYSEGMSNRLWLTRKYRPDH